MEKYKNRRESRKRYIHKRSTDPDSERMPEEQIVKNPNFHIDKNKHKHNFQLKIANL